MYRRYLNYWPETLLALLLGIQILLLINSVVYPLATMIWQVGSRPPVERSAEIAFGSDFAGYIGFVREAAPLNARVVVPPMDNEPVYGNIGLMQYFLFPREVVNCPSGNGLDECIGSLRGTRTFILAINGFPNKDAVPDNKMMLMFDGGRGVYIPDGND